MSFNKYIYCKIYIKFGMKYANQAKQMLEVVKMPLEVERF